MVKQALRVPHHLGFRLKEIVPGTAFIGEFCGEWVVKPAHGAGGRGVTTGVRSGFDLVRAAVNAAAYESMLVVEQ